MNVLREFLQRTPFFGGLVDQALDHLIAMLAERRFAVGDEVVREGQPGTSMFIIHEGDLVVCKAGASGTRVRIVHLGPGDFFGETALIAVQPRTATVVAEAPSLLYELTARGLYQLYQSDVHAYVMVLQNINRELCRRLRGADQRITDFANLAGDEETQIRPHRPR